MVEIKAQSFKIVLEVPIGALKDIKGFNPVRKNYKTSIKKWCELQNIKKWRVT